MLKEFEELLLDNTLLKVQNPTLGDKNPKWKEWWQIIHEFIEEQIQDNMELVCSDEQSYQLELQAYQIIFPDSKYEPLSFVSVEIGTSIKVPATPSMVQPVIKSIHPLRSGTSFKIMPLPIHTFTILVLVTIVVSQHVEGSENFDKEHVEHVNSSFTVLYSRLESLEFISISVLLTTH
jgi:hypothetical protein